MSNYFIIKVKHRTQTQWLIWLILVITFFVAPSIQILHFPSVMRYGLDLLWLLLLLVMIKSHKFFYGKEMFFLCGWVGVFLIITLINYAFHYQSVFYYLWGFRNNFRFYVVFIACVLFMQGTDAEEGLKLYDKMFWLNGVVCFVQYFVFDIKRDNLGGIFGTEEGCNGALNIFFVIVVIKTIIFYLNKKEGLFNCVLKCGMVLVISALAELKFFYIEFVIIIIIAMLITDFSFRKLFVIVGAFIGLMLGIGLLIDIFPTFSDFFTIEGIIDSATDVAGYTASGDMNRFTGISIVNERFLRKIDERIFGLGLGNCDYASYDFLISPFFRQYSELHYTWLSTAWIYLENGILGLILFFGFFVLVAIFALNKLRQKQENKSVIQVVFVLSICCILIGIYNSSLRMEAAYLAYYVLSMAFWREYNCYDNKPKVFMENRKYESG